MWQSRETENIGHRRRRKTKQKHTTIYLQAAVFKHVGKIEENE